MFGLSSRKCAALPTHSQHTVSLVSVSLALINVPLRVLSLYLLPSLPLSPNHPSGGSSAFCSAVVCFWPFLCQSVASCLLSLQALGYLFPMSTPGVHLALVVFLSVFWSFLSSSLFFFPALSSAIISRPPLNLAFSILSSSLLTACPLPFLLFSPPHRTVVILRDFRL